MIVLLLVAIAILYLLFRPELKGTFEMTSEQVDWIKAKMMHGGLFLNIACIVVLTVFSILFWV